MNIWTILFLVFMIFMLNCTLIDRRGVRAIDGSLYGSMASWQGITQWMLWGGVCGKIFPLFRRRQMTRSEMIQFSIASLLLLLFLITWLAPNTWNYSEVVDFSSYFKLVLVSWLVFLSLFMFTLIAFSKQRWVKSTNSSKKHR
ncbi:hypothetical protein IQ249_20070 [Lusitaniella coriacea LEGE 07157]|uniref:Uncharacterized protein n=1 Tax=Lusitaniella coriacea LEGE 07157 TaxID=945747 RepID=A0A8J7DZ21_9CYAN|nr:hypothetical protein [Lusitaniella coriacea]MBE9118194.1 hypothetical protein [Lusitaniella coriacea LEGE 07157]